MASFYIARQPILDTAGNTYGYELLFRSTDKNTYDSSVDGDIATARVLINAILETGFQSLVGNGMGFINCTNRFLENPELLELLPAGRCVLEVLESVNVTDELVAGVTALKEMGHKIALDDFVDETRFQRLLPLADIVKYDVTEHSMEELVAYRQIDAAAGRLSLVERVESHEQFSAFKDAGFNYFQGYYFAKPRIISGAELPQNRMSLMQLLTQINDPGSTIEELADTVSQDVSLGLRTLRYVNSPMAGLVAKVSSIRHATILLGRETIKNWVTLLIMSDIDDKPAALIKMALTRARFCQLIAIDRKLEDDAMYFTIGLLSLLDVLMDTDLESALAVVSVNQHMKDQLMYRSGIGGEMLNGVEYLEKEPYCLPDSIVIDFAGQRFQSASQWAEQTYGMF